MATILPFKGVWPRLHESVFLADGARVIGDVEIGADSSVWFNAVVRGDVCPIRIGQRTNVQDNVTLHVTHDTGPLTIGDRVTIGHNAVLHACTVHEEALIGMGAVLLDHCVIESRALVAAGSLVRGGFVAPTGTLVAGVPAQVKRPLTEDEMRNLEESPDNYARYVAAYRQGGYDTKPIAGE
ncbi:serine acetyltransferase [Pseudobythopirellula maris]|uniref:Serine acetyltransferase n=1 Tax=Pseudobythopirellula maris TaxID=2527991 RepID=A0A5C5ZSN3_9BACT|nr:gamma carbonic anhydrase family protein [Pseudobythopirellula maris]TWT90552.1 serine acetyltransferase [Pseudobythopirellula maris]